MGFMHGLIGFLLGAVCALASIVALGSIVLTCACWNALELPRYVDDYLECGVLIWGSVAGGATLVAILFFFLARWWIKGIVPFFVKWLFSMTLWQWAILIVVSMFFLGLLLCESPSLSSISVAGQCRLVVGNRAQ